MRCCRIFDDLECGGALVMELVWPSFARRSSFGDVQKDTHESGTLFGGRRFYGPREAQYVFLES